METVTQNEITSLAQTQAVKPQNTLYQDLVLARDVRDLILKTQSESSEEEMYIIKKSYFMTKINNI